MSFMLISVPCTLAARVAFKVLKDQCMKMRVGQVLSDGSVVRAFGHVESTSRSDGWKVCPKPIRALALARNGVSHVKEKAFGKDMRIFVALEVPTGEIVLLLMNEHAVDEAALQDPKTLKGKVDSTFAQGMGLYAATLDRTTITEVEAGIFRLATDVDKTMGSRQHFDLRVVSGPPTEQEASVNEGSQSITYWLREHSKMCDNSKSNKVWGQENVAPAAPIIIGA